MMMNKNCLRNARLISASVLVLMSAAQAGTPVWTFVPVTGYPPTVTVSTAGTAIIQYTLTNQSHKSHLLKMKSIQGVTSSGCASPLGYHQSCTLTLNVRGSALKGDVLGGPVLCDQGNLLLCYQPSRENGLAIRLTQQPPIQHYTVTPSVPVNGSLSPSTTQVVTSGTTITFTAMPNAGYGVNQWLVDGNVVQTGGTTYQLTNITTNHTVNVTFATATLTASVSTLALSVNCQPSSSCSTTQNVALTGNPRQITIQNTGSISTVNLAVSASGLPSGTSISSNTCNSTLNPGDSCIVTLTPGAITSSDSSNSPCGSSNTPPTGNSVTITADNSPSIQINAYVLSYGCQYQGGFIYSVDDTTPNTGSIGGKVAALVDQVPPESGIIWSSNGNSGTSSDVDYTPILGIDETSTTSTPSPTSPAYPAGTPAYTACNGSSNGICDTSNILSYYNYNRASGGSAPTPLTYYAAGFCDQSINSYSDWYLPSICEMDPITGTAPCPSGIQSIIVNLSFLVGDPFGGSPTTSCGPPSGTECLPGYYWSSTETGFAPNHFAWTEFFASLNISQGNAMKNQLKGVRCARALTF